MTLSKTLLGCFYVTYLLSSQMTDKDLISCSCRLISSMFQLVGVFMLQLVATSNQAVQLHLILYYYELHVLSSLFKFSKSC